MRFKISLHPEGERLKLPYSYNHALAAAIYSFLAQADSTFSQFLHQGGFYHKGKAFKLFTFSPLLSKRRKAIKDGLLMEGRIDWFISSPREEFVTSLAQGILAQGFLPFLNQRLIVEEVEVLSQPAFGDQASFRTLSPIVVSTGEVGSNGKFHKKFLSPEEPEFSQILEENLKRKYQACYGKEAPAPPPVQAHRLQRH